MSWKQLAALLRDVRYRVYRLANLAISEAYLNFHLWRTGRSEQFKTATVGQLSRRLRGMLSEEGVKDGALDRISKTGATAANVHDALSKYKVAALTSPSKWRDVTRGKASLPTFRLDMAIPVRCDKLRCRRLERTANADVELDLQICAKPYPRVVLETRTKAVGEAVRAILERLLDNPAQSLDGYRQRCFEIKHDDRTNKWWLYVTYDFPAAAPLPLDPNVVVGVDLGVSCPLYAALSNGHARLGRRQFQALGARIRSLQTQVMARRRSVQVGGRVALSQATARSGHGRKRKLRPTEKLEGRIASAYTTLNHQLSAALIDFAKNHGAGVVQIEDLTSLKEALRGTFLGGRWRYHQLQQYLEYKAQEAGIALRRVDPRFTSRRCSRCGHINVEFDRSYRDARSTGRRPGGFVCPTCDYGGDSYVDPDYNAARNLAVVDIAAKITAQCKAQGLSRADDV
jgi:putative transposase